MKKVLIKFLSISFVIMLCIGSFTCFADGSLITNGDMESETVSFVRSTGDVNRDGIVNGTDITSIINYLIGKTLSDSYLDVNGNSDVNIIDLVLMKKLCDKVIPVRANVGRGPSKGLVVDSTNPEIAYKNALVSSMKTNTTYQLTYDCKTDSNVRFTIKGAKVGNVVSDSGVCANFTTKSLLFTTGNSLTADLGNEFIITGNGTVDNISVEEVTRYWSDSSAKEQGGKDIYAQ